MDNNIFDYNFKIKNDETIIDENWAIIEEVLMLPTTFISPTGKLLYLFRMNDKTRIDSWILIVPKDKDTLIKFLEEKLTYRMLISSELSECYLVNWDLKKDECSIKGKFTTNNINNIPNFPLAPIDSDLISELIRRIKNG